MARRSTLRLAACLAAAALALLPGTAAAAYRAFRSPSGKLGCAFYSGQDTPRTVRCEWTDSNDRALTLTQTGRARRIKISDTVRDPKAPVLAYGHSTSFGRLKCTSRRTGITCRSTSSGHGFMVSVQRQRVF
jgi:hypothetical protein